MGIKSLFSWLLGLWGTGDAASTPRGHTGQREGQVPCRAAPQICGSAEQHEPDPELSLGVCAPMGTAMVSPVYRDALAQYGASPRVGSTVGAARAPSPPASAGRESQLLHGDRGAQPCVQKYLYCSLCPPAAPRAPGCLAVLVPAPTAQLSRGGSRAAPVQPRARCHREQSCGAAPATDTG